MNNALFKKLVEKIYSQIFDLPTEELKVHYEEVKKELIKRGVKNV